MRKSLLPYAGRLGNINGILGPAGTGGPTRGHATARMNTPSRQNAGDREGHVAAWGGPDAVGRGGPISLKAGRSGGGGETNERCHAAGPQPDRR